MKIRNGFVSNSSSSSFCIYGTCIDLGNFSEKLNESTILSKKFSNDDFIEMYDNNDWYSLLEFISENTNLEFFRSDDDNITWIGKSWSTIGDNETGGEFKNSVVSELSTLFGSDNLDCGTWEL